MYPARRVLANGAHAVTSGPSNASEGDAEHADRSWLEAVPHIAFMGSLQRVVSGGGTLHRELAANRGRVDLVVSYGSDRFDQRPGRSWEERLWREDLEVDGRRLWLRGA